MNIKGKFKGSLGPIVDNGKFSIDISTYQIAKVFISSLLHILILVQPSIQGILSGELVDVDGHKEFNFTDVIGNIKMKTYHLELEDNFRGMPMLSKKII